MDEGGEGKAGISLSVSVGLGRSVSSEPLLVGTTELDVEEVGAEVRVMVVSVVLDEVLSVRVIVGDDRVMVSVFVAEVVRSVDEVTETLVGSMVGLHGC